MKPKPLKTWVIVGLVLGLVFIALSAVNTRMDSGSSKPWAAVGLVLGAVGMALRAYGSNEGDEDQAQGSSSRISALTLGRVLTPVGWGLFGLAILYALVAACDSTFPC